MLALKKSLRLLPIYIWVFLVCSLFVTLVYIFYAKACALVAGGVVAVPLKTLLIRSFFSTFPVILIFVTISLGFYRVRHPAGGFLSVIFYIGLCAFSWLFLYPAFVGLKSTYVHPALQVETVPLSKGYFRKNGEVVIYFQKELSSAENLVLIRPKANEEHALLQKEVSRDSLLEETLPFQDSIIRDSVSLFPSWIIEGYKVLTSSSETAREKSFLKFVGSISWALALCAMYGFTFCTQWRLLAVLYLIIMDAGVLSFNVLYHSFYFDAFREAGEKIVSGIPLLSVFDDALLFSINMLLILIAIFVGLLAGAVSKRREVV